MFIEFLTHNTNGPYFFALSFLTLFFIFEILGLLLGMSLSNAFDSSIDFEMSAGGHLTLLGLGKVPLIIWLTFFLGLFSIIGYSANAMSYSMFGYMPIWVSIVPVFIASFVINSFLCRLFSRFFPKIETTAVNTDTFVGRVANVTIGDATYTNFAMGVVLDEHKTSHNIRIQSMDEGVVLPQHKKVILVQKAEGSAIWLAMPYDSNSL